MACEVRAMRLQGALEKLLEELLAEWDRAEEAVKQAEFIQGEVVAPSVNELRYAGRKVVEALQLAANNDAERAQRLLNDAIFDCMRARHDAVDAITAFISMKLDAVTEEIGVDVVLQCFPDMPKLVAALGRVEEVIATSREDRTNRDAIYETLRQTDLREIVDLYGALKANEKLMQARAEELALDRRRADRRFWWGLLIGFLGLLVGVAGWFL